MSTDLVQEESYFVKFIKVRVVMISDRFLLIGKMQVSCDLVKSCSWEDFPYSRYFHMKILTICVPNTFKTIAPKLFNNNVHPDKCFEFFKGEFTPRA